MSRDARFKGQVGIAHTEDVVDALVVVVELDDRAGRELPLKSKVKSIRVRSFERWINGDRDAADGKSLAANGEIAKGVLGE
jgi:hypothetical protein